MSIVAAKLKVLVGGDTKEADKAIKDLHDRIQGMGDRLSNVGKNLTLAFTLPLAGIGKKAIDLAAGYSSAMNILQATSKASAEEMVQLDKMAQDLGKDLTLPATSAADAAEAMVELSKSGLKVNDILGASRGVLQLSAAGNLSNAAAAEIASNALNMFKLRGDQAVKVADLLSAAANASSAEVVDMADSLKMAGSVFAAADIPIEDLVAAIAEMANQGIKGSDAGTSLKQMLLALQAPTDKARDLMSGLGITIYDAKGQLLPFQQIVGSFTGRLGRLTQEQRNAALATIFGSDAVRAANVVMMGGIPAFEEMRKKVTEQGAAAELAGARMTGLSGSIEQMKSALETAMLAVGNAAAGPFMELAKKVTDAANAFSNLSPAAQEAWIKFGVGLALIGPTTFALGKMITLFAGMPAVITGVSTALQALKLGFSLTNSLALAGLSPIAVGLGAIAIAAGAIVAVWNTWNKKIVETNKEGQKAVKTAWGAFFEKQVADGKDATQVLAEYQAAQARVQKEIDNSSIVVKTFLFNQKELKQDTAGLASALAVTSSNYKEYTTTMAQAGLSANMYSLAQWEAYRATQGLGAAQAETLPAAEQYAGVMSDTSRRVLEASRAAQEAANANRGALKAAFEEVVASAVKSKEELGNLVGQYDDLKKKMDDWVSNTASQVVDMLGNKFSEASEKYRKALAEVDTLMGTNYTKQLETKDAVKNLVDQYARSGDLDAFRSGLQKIKDEGLKDMQKQLDDVVTKAQALYDKLLALPTSIKIKIDFVESGYPGWVGTQAGSNRQTTATRTNARTDITLPEERHAGGPVQAGVPYIVRPDEEVYVPKRDGQMVLNENLRPVSVTVNATLNREMDMYVLAQRIAEEIRRNRM